MKRMSFAAVALVALVAGLLAWRPLTGDAASSSARAPVAGGSAGAPGLPLPAHAGGAPAFTTGLEDLPASLAGTEVPDGLHAGPDGHLVIDVAVRDVFDYFLATVGEEDLPTVAARLRAYIAGRLADPARSEALALLESYLAFWQAAGELSRAARTASGADTPEAMAAYLAQLRELRSRHFDRATDTALFGAQDAFQDYTLARTRLLRDPALTDVQRAQQLAALLGQLPPSAQEALRTATLVQTLDDVTASCRRNHCSAEQLRQVREELVGVEAAGRLADLDREEAALQAKLATYFLQRDGIAANPAYDDADRRAQIGALQRELFSDDELLRLVALEQIHDRAARTN